ncbi:MAG: DUF3303 domain-containing protein [Hyphomicrobiales bacterium]|nr:MAG: DUF3303 domain-containing protein [Hyphomicrobiales bacterium]
MKFIKTFSLRNLDGAADKALARFAQTRAEPPKGVTLLGRWYCADMSMGFELLESDDVTALNEFAARWLDVFEMSIVPVVEDAELVEVMGRLRN